MTENAEYVIEVVFYSMNLQPGKRIHKYCQIERLINKEI